jgi:hypothetical protein
LRLQFYSVPSYSPVSTFFNPSTFASKVPTIRQHVTAGAVGSSGRSSFSNDNYLESLTGYFVPLYSGNYTFMVGGDDDCDLALSPNANASGLVIVASTPAYNDIQSVFWMYPTQKAPMRCVCCVCVLCVCVVCVCYA